MSRTINFNQFFGKTPFPALQAHMELAVECTEQLPEMIKAAAAQDTVKLKELKRKIYKLEQDADNLFDELSSQLPISMFLPVHRHDLIAVLEQQENIADTSQDIAGLLRMPLEVSAELVDPLVDLAEVGIACCRQALEVIRALDELIEAGFKGPDLPRVLGMIDEIASIEDGSDRLAINLTKELYRHRDGTDPVTVVMLFQLIRWLGNISDHADLVGSRCRFLIAK